MRVCSAGRELRVLAVRMPPFLALIAGADPAAVIVSLSLVSGVRSCLVLVRLRSPDLRQERSHRPPTTGWPTRPGRLSGCSISRDEHRIRRPLAAGIALHRLSSISRHSTARRRSPLPGLRNLALSDVKGAPGGRPARCGRYLRPPSSLAPPANEPSAPQLSAPRTPDRRVRRRAVARPAPFRTSLRLALHA